MEAAQSYFFEFDILDIVLKSAECVSVLYVKAARCVSQCRSCWFKWRWRHRDVEADQSRHWSWLVGVCECLQVCDMFVIVRLLLRLLLTTCLRLAVDIIWAMVIVWRITRKIIRTVLCCVVDNSCAHTCEQFLKFTVGLRLGLVFCVFVWVYHFVFYFWFSLDCFVLVLLLLSCYILFLQYYTKRLARKNVSKVTCSVLSGMQNLNSVNLSSGVGTGAVVTC